MKLHLRNPLLLVSATVVIAACAGSGRAPNAPIALDAVADAANQEYQQKQINNQAAATAPTQPQSQGVIEPDALQHIANLTKEFVAEVVAQTTGTRGRIAVFPPFVRTTTTTRWRVAELGDLIAEEVALNLRANGRQVLSGRALLAAIGQANRGLNMLTDEASVIALSQRLAGLSFVGAVTTGTIDVTSEGGFSGAQSVAVRLRATSLGSAGTIVSKDLRIANARAVANIVRQLERPGAWRIGSAATTFRPTVDRELNVLATTALARLFDQSPELILNRRIAVLPIEVPSTAASTRKLVAMQKAIGQALDASERRAQVAGESDPLQAALDGPLRVSGRDYDSGSAALMHYQQERAQTLGTPAAALCGDLAATMGEAIRAIAGDKVEIVASDDRRLAVSLVQADMLEYQTEHSVNPDSIGEVRGNAPDVLVRTKLGRRIEDYALTVRIFDLASPNRGRSETITLPEWMVEPIRSALNR